MYLGVELSPAGFKRLLDAAECMIDGAVPVEKCGPSATGEGTREVVTQLGTVVAAMDLARAWGDDAAALRARAARLMARFEERAKRLERRRMS